MIDILILFSKENISHLLSQFKTKNNCPFKKILKIVIEKLIKKTQTNWIFVKK